MIGLPAPTRLDAAAQVMLAKMEALITQSTAEYLRFGREAASCHEPADKKIWQFMRDSNEALLNAATEARSGLMQMSRDVQHGRALKIEK